MVISDFIVLEYFQVFNGLSFNKTEAFVDERFDQRFKNT